MERDLIASHWPQDLRSAFVEPPKPLDFVLPGLPVGCVGALVSPGGVGKSMLALQLAMQFVMYLTPVVFTVESIESTPWPWITTLYKINPLTPLILSTRDWLTGYSPDYMGYFFLINGLTIFTLLIVWVIYRIAMPIIIERMSA